VNARLTNAASTKPTLPRIRASSSCQLRRQSVLRYSQPRSLVGIGEHRSSGPEPPTRSVATMEVSHVCATFQRRAGVYRISPANQTARNVESLVARGMILPLSDTSEDQRLEYNRPMASNAGDLPLDLTASNGSDCSSDY
jgi:hypothetical protein